MESLVNQLLDRVLPSSPHTAVVGGGASRTVGRKRCQVGVLVPVNIHLNHDAESSVADVMEKRLTSAAEHVVVGRDDVRPEIDGREHEIVILRGRVLSDVDEEFLDGQVEEGFEPGRRR